MLPPGTRTYNGSIDHNVAKRWHWFIQSRPSRLLCPTGSSKVPLIWVFERPVSKADTPSAMHPTMRKKKHTDDHTNADLDVFN
jgi:hypothetical protein